MFKWPKGKDSFNVSHQGTDNPWVTIQSLVARQLKGPLSSGYRINKILIPVLQREKGGWGRGDVVRVKLQLESHADITWVVVSDPIPAGSSILGTGLGRDSQLLSMGEKEAGWFWAAFEERSCESFRAYYEYVPKGLWTLEYTIMLNSECTFIVPETTVESLYAPEMFGIMPNGKIEIKR